jgi:glutathione S-transferase
MSEPALSPENRHRLILYDHPSSPCARRVRITLLEKELSWDTQIIDLARLEQRRPEYLRLNPNGFVPTLAHGERVIYESNVITEYLDDAFPQRPLYPQDAWELAQVKMWQASELAMAKDYRPLMYQRLMGPMLRLTSTLDEALEAARRSTSEAADLAWEERVWNLAVLTADEEAQLVDRLWKWLANLDAHLEGRQFLVGERFTQAEVSVYPRVAMYPFVQLHITADRFPNVTRWMKALAQRPSFSKTLSTMDAQILRLSRTSLLPWLGRTLRKPEPSLVERLRLRLVRRMARRTMRAARAAAERARGTGAIRQPQPAAVAPAAVPVRRPPAAPAELLTQPLTLYDDAESPHARRIRMLLREKSLSWQTVDVPLHRLAHKAPAYLAVNPIGEVPALRHGKRVIYDSQLIAEYLDRTFTGNPLYPDDAYALAEVRMWLALEAGTHKEFRPLFYLHVVRPALRAAGIDEASLDAVLPSGVDPSHVQWLRDTLRGAPRFDSSEQMARAIVSRKLERLAERVAERDYLVGETCTMADLGWFTRVDMLPRLGIPLPSAVARWAERIGARPSARESRP